MPYDAIAVTLLNHIREVLGSNIGLTKGFRFFPQSLQESIKARPRPLHFQSSNHPSIRC
jgi:hypothetical protein